MRSWPLLSWPRAGDGLAVQLANALYGSALAHVMTAEVAAEQAGVGGGYRGEAWRAAGSVRSGDQPASPVP